MIKSGGSKVAKNKKKGGGEFIESLIIIFSLLLEIVIIHSLMASVTIGFKNRTKKSEIRGRCNQLVPTLETELAQTEPARRN